MIAALMLLGAASVSAPNAGIIESLLLRKEYCTATVDGCIDRDGRQVHANTRYAVSNVVCENSEANRQAWRCSYDVTRTYWMEGEQVGEAALSRMTDIFEAISVIDRSGKKKIRGVIWMQRSPEDGQSRVEKTR